MSVKPSGERQAGRRRGVGGWERVQGSERLQAVVL